jgi:ATP-dependent RNA helicase DeaD
MKKSFKDLGISEPILKAMVDMGFQTPTEVQSKAIPPALNREDLIVTSKTGSGKTAVFGVPMLQMTNPKEAGPQGLILAPTRELAVQVDNELKLISKYLPHRTTSVYGQHSIHVENQALQKGVSIVTGTPGRVLDHIKRRNLATKHIRFLVIDEADRMLDLGFIDQVTRIVEALPRNRVTLLFSATMPPEVIRVCKKHMRNPTNIIIESPTKTVDIIEQMYYRVEANEKRSQLHRLLLVEQPESCLVFCNTRVAVDRVRNFLAPKGYAVQALHGDIPQGRRMQTIKGFKQGKFHVLVATDVAARGLHIEDLSLVINYDVPVEMDSYVHRIGRTGRVGKKGRAATLVTSEDIMTLYEIEEHIGALIPEADLPSETMVNERRASAKRWINSKRQTGSAGKSQSRSRSKGTQKKRSPKRPRQPQQDRPLRTNADPKIAVRQRPEHSAEQVKQPQIKENTVEVKKPASAPPPPHRKPFLQRLAKRILGK